MISNYSVLIIKNDPVKRSSNDPTPGKFGRFNIVMIIDLDHFKSLNNRYGHAASDLVLDQ